MTAIAHNLTPPAHRIPRAKLALRSGLGSIVVHEVRDVEFRVEPHAQYPSSLVVSFVPKSARKRRMVRVTSLPFCVVFHGDVPEQATWTPTVAHGEVAITRTRYTSCDPAWANEWRANFVAAVAAGRARVEFDACDWNAHEVRP